MSKFVINKSTLTDIGNAIREKNSTSEPIPVTALATEIRALDTSGLSEEIVFTGNLSNIFSQQGFNTSMEGMFVPLLTSPYLQFIKFRDVTSAHSAFREQDTLEDLSALVINMDEADERNVLAYMFYNCMKLKKLPQISGPVGSLSKAFFNCQYLTTEEYEKFFKNIYPRINENLNTGLEDYFWQNNRVRNLEAPLNFLDSLVHKTEVDYTVFGYDDCFFNCRLLDSIDNLPVVQARINANTAFYQAFQDCCRLKDMKFNLNNGVPYTAPWAGVSIRLDRWTGWAPSSFQEVMEASGLPQVTDDVTYQALKNSPDWWTTNSNYSRYNYDSAVNTINTLPDTSAYVAANPGTGANTISFLGTAGALTDGGAINTLTEEEIAVAAAKGWTVSLS